MISDDKQENVNKCKKNIYKNVYKKIDTTQIKFRKIFFFPDQSKGLYLLGNCYTLKEKEKLKWIFQPFYKRRPMTTTV